MWKMRLSRAGYGDMESMDRMDVKRFLDLINYENYLAQYENVTRELNKRDK